MPKLLIIDDDPTTIFTLKKILGKEGYEIIEALGGKEALELLKSEEPDLILLDVMMPELDGWEISKKIRSSKKTGKIPIAMLTVRGEQEDRVKSFEDGRADAHINKPFIREELLNTIKWLLTHASKEVRSKGGDKG